jgi:hypothetical protein
MSQTSMAAPAIVVATAATMTGLSGRNSSSRNRRTPAGRALGGAREGINRILEQS